MAVFRFLINVDKCLDTTHYNCFFYKLKSRGTTGQGLFHLSEAQLLDGDSLSLHNAVSDIRMYLDKYPYEVEDYRIILLMRSTYTKTIKKWEDTLLYRLLRLRYEFLKSNIMLSTAVEAERENALNFIMLYDSTFATDLPELKPYFSSKRLSDDVALLLENYGVNPENGSLDDLFNGLEATYLKTGYKDEVFSAENYSAPHEADFIRRYYESSVEKEKISDSYNSILTLVSSFAKELLFNYRIYERFLNSSDRRDETLSFLRITDFINHDTESKIMIGGNTGISTLAQRCDDAWNEVWNDKDTKERFATMLAQYSVRLRNAEISLSQPTLADANTDLPVFSEPSLTEIGGHRVSFSEDSEEQRRREDVLHKLKNYSKKKLFFKSFREEWNNTYEDIVVVLNNLKGSLKIYAQDLSREYANVLAQRKKETVDWKNGNYAALPSEKERLEIVEEKRGGVLKCLKKPHMNPSLSFQDVLNSEKKLEQASKIISFYLDCMKEASIINFVLILAICSVFFVLHYTILQPYNFSEMNSMIYYLCYIVVAIVLMGTMAWLPYRHYCKRVQKSLKTLEQELEVYIKSYYDRAQNFSEYINYINNLDYLTRYRDLLSRAIRRGYGLNMGQLWHREQISKHLEMLNFFSGLIDSAPPLGIIDDISIVSVVSNGQIRDVADCPIYWPQA